MAEIAESMDEFLGNVLTASPFGFVAGPAMAGIGYVRPPPRGFEVTTGSETLLLSFGKLVGGIGLKES
jgi:hypothetical protein